MLTRLSVENYVLIDRLDLELGSGLNIVTGETGAGKSILLGALGLLLGSKAESGVIRDAERACVVEGEFAIEGYGLEGFFEDNDLDFEDVTTIRRVISSGGKSRAYVNELPVQLTLLKELGGRLIDIHSQHQNLMLGSDAFRCAILDGVAGNAQLLGEYRAAYERWQRADKELRALREQAAQAAREEEYLRFQCEQLEAARLLPGEQVELEAGQAELAHAEQIREALGAAGELLEAEEGILPRLKSAAGQLASIAAHYPAAQPLRERLESSLRELRDIHSELSGAADRVTSDPHKLQRLTERLDLLYTLEKKHGADDLDALIAIADDYAARLALIDSSSDQITALEARTAELHAAAGALAARLTERRTQAASEVKAHVEKLLENLGMAGSRLIVELAPADTLRPTGGDITRFLFSSTPGIAPAAIEKVASGGETSRLMLALKSLVASRSALPTIIFDEIDAGVSGRIADAMGEIIVATARHLQVVNITHLPQVASKGQTHLLVYKQNAQTHIRRLTPDERVHEIAKMISGNTITDAAIQQAKLLLNS